MTLSVRNEADTIEDFIRYHLAVGIDGILVSDRGSSDGTLAILDRLSSQLPLVVLEHSLEAGAGRSAEERLGRFAADRLAAQWVIDGSISEFWLTDGSDLLQGGEPIAEDVGEILVNTTTFLSRNPAEGWSTVRESTSDSSSARRMRRVAGNGGTSLHLSPDRAMVGLVPAPSHEVLVQRAITSGMESDLGLVGELGASATWASLFSSWLEGALDIDAAQHAVDPVEVGAGMADGSMVVDHRIVEVLAAADGHLRDLEPIPLAPPSVDTRSDGFILVAGMHRSGTSAVARVINLLGADIGDAAALMEAKPDNPSGFWENQAFAAIDDDVVALLGGRWDDIPPRAVDWPFDPRFDDLRNRAQEVAQEFSDAPKRVVKDPRLSITLPFWRGVIPIAGVVLPIRHPMEVAGSLWARDDMDQEVAGELWCAYVESTLAADPGCVIVDYGRLVADPVGTASLLADALGLPQPSDSAADAITRFLDPSLRHHEQLRPEHTIGRRMREAIAMYDALLADDRWEAMTIASARIDAVRLDSARHRLLRMEHEWALARVHAAELIRERDHVWKLRDEADARAADLANRNRLQDDELAQLEAVNRRLLGKSAHQPNQKAEAVSTERMLDKLRRRMRSRRPGEG